MNTYDFDGHVALVTGAGSGIGKACALTFAGGGASVVAVDINKSDGERVAAEINAAGGKAIFVSCDVSKFDQVSAAVDLAVETYGKIDILVNNAGIGGAALPTGEYPLESWHQVIDINLHGVFYGMRAAIPAMLANGSGAIVNMASILGTVGFATASAYVAAKHAIVGSTKAAALEYSAQGLRINSVGPGFIRTPLLENNLDEASLDAIAGLHASKRLGSAQEVANLVAFLCSEDAAFITGGYYLVDGGYTAQ